VDELFSRDPRANRKRFAALCGALAFPWLVYAWVAITGVTCSLGRGRYAGRATEPPRVATPEDLTTALQAAIFFNFVVLVTVLLAWLMTRKKRG
jgi:hypothetical protein